MYTIDTLDGYVELWVDLFGDGNEDDFQYMGTFEDHDSAARWYEQNC